MEISGDCWQLASLNIFINTQENRKHSDGSYFADEIKLSLQNPAVEICSELFWHWTHLRGAWEEAIQKVVN